MRTMANWCWALALLGVFGCSAVPEATDVGADQPPGKIEQAYTNSPYRGGQGGDPKWTGWGNFTGFRMSCGAYVDSLLGEAEVIYQNQLYPHWALPLATGGGGTQRPWFSCPAGQYLLGMWGKADTYINKLSFICGTPDRSVFTYLYDFCGNTDSGQLFIDACPTGQIIRGISGRAGSWLDGIQIFCDTPQFPVFIP